MSKSAIRKQHAVKIPKRFLKALALVKDGADVHSRELAGALREIERRYPSLIQIVGLQMYRGDGTGVVPFFGAIATVEGRRALKP